MKKVLALILCALMIVTAALPVFAVDPEPETAGKLAITEVSPNPASSDTYTNYANYEYIEVINTTNETLNLKDYYIYRMMFSHGGNWGYNGLTQLLGKETFTQATVKLSLEGFDVQLTKNTPVVIWLDSLRTEEDDTSFRAYWGIDNSVTVCRLSVPDTCIVNNCQTALADASQSFSYSGKGLGFLPDSKTGYIVSLINSTFAAADTEVSATPICCETAIATVSTAARHEAADSIAVLYAFSAVPGKVANRYGYFDEAGFKAARAKAGENETVPLADAYLYDSLMMPRPDVDGGVDIVPITNTNGYYRIGDNKNNGTAFFLNPVCYEEATPGALVTGQFDGQKLGSASNVTTTGLAITEIMPAAIVDGTGSSTTDWEFIEVKNTKTSAVTLTNYRLTLAGWTDNGGNDDVFFARWFDAGSSANSKGYATVASVWTIGAGATAESADATPASAELAKGNTAVIWFCNDTENTKAKVEGFAKYWEGRGSDMDGVTVAVATYAVGTSIDNGTTAKRGNGFIPDAKFSFAICLVDSAKSVDGLTAALETAAALTTAGTSEKSRLIEAEADSIVSVLHGDYAEANVSCNYFGYIDQTKYAHDAIYYSQNLLAQNTAPTYTNAIYPVTNNTVVMKDQPLRNLMSGGGSYGTGDGQYGKAGSVGTRAASSVYVHTAFDSVPTPGALLDGQFGYEADKALISVAGYQTATEAVDGATDVRIIGKLNVAEADLSKYSVIGIEVAAAEEATNARTSDQTANNGGTNIVCNKANSVCKKQIEITTDKVYKTLTDEAGTVYANGDNYMFAINLAGIPVGNCNLTFRVYVVENGVKTYTGFYQITDTSI